MLCYVYLLYVFDKVTYQVTLQSFSKDADPMLCDSNVHMMLIYGGVQTILCDPCGGLSLRFHTDTLQVLGESR